MTARTRRLAAAIVLTLATVLTGCASAGHPAGTDLITLTGTVRAAPACPGPESLDSPCPPRPVDGATVDADQGGHRVARTTTDGAGRFTLRLAAGTYQITATNTGGIRSTATTTATLPGTSDLTLVVDSGMR